MAQNIAMNIKFLNWEEHLVNIEEKKVNYNDKSSHFVRVFCAVQRRAMDEVKRQVQNLFWLVRLSPECKEYTGRKKGNKTTPRIGLHCREY